MLHAGMLSFLGSTLRTCVAIAAGAQADAPPAGAVDWVQKTVTLPGKLNSTGCMIACSDALTCVVDVQKVRASHGLAS